jgi:hypothetical protein
VPINFGWAIIPLTMALAQEMHRIDVPDLQDASAPQADAHSNPRIPLTEWLEEISRDGVLVINAALKCMGVSREPSMAGGLLDEFDTVGLNRRRKTHNVKQA